MLITLPTAAASWAPRGAADWAPLLVSGIVLSAMFLALVVGDQSPTEPRETAPANVEPVTPHVAPPAFRAVAPRVQSASRGSIRLVGTRVLPRQSSHLTSADDCPRAQPETPSASASAAMQAGWHVGADLHQSGYQVVLVDAGVERRGERCVPIGASVLVFIESGLVAIAYDRSGGPASRLAAIEPAEPDGVKLMGGAGALAHLALGDQLIVR